MSSSSSSLPSSLVSTNVDLTAAAAASSSSQPSPPVSPAATTTVPGEGTTTRTTSRQIVLISRDNVRFELSRAAAKLSDFVRDTLNLDDDDDDEDADNDENVEEEEDYEPVVVPRVGGACLAKVVEFLVHHATVRPMPEIRQPLGGSTFQEVMPDGWYQSYMSLDNMKSRQEVFEVLAAANYMSIKPLLDLVCLWCTFQLEGKSADEIRVFLNLQQLTVEEEQNARRDYPWIFDDEE